MFAARLSRERVRAPAGGRRCDLGTIRRGGVDRAPGSDGLALGKKLAGRDSCHVLNALGENVVSLMTEATYRRDVDALVAPVPASRTVLLPEKGRAESLTGARKRRRKQASARRQPRTVRASRAAAGQDSRRQPPRKVHSGSVAWRWPGWRLKTAPRRSSPPASGLRHCPEKSNCRPLGARSPDVQRVI